MNIKEDENRFTPSGMILLEEAFCFANRLHGGQMRKGTNVPYMTHLIGVMALVIDHGGDEEQAMAALLHDAVEDQGGQCTLDEIKRRFGDRVAMIVVGCTDAYTYPKPEWLPRKERYLEHLRDAPEEVRLVSLADKVHNTRAIVSDRNRIGDKVWERFTASREQSLWYYGELLKIFTNFGDCPPLVGALRSAVEELNRI